MSSGRVTKAQLIHHVGVPPTDVSDDDVVFVKVAKYLLGHFAGDRKLICTDGLQVKAATGRLNHAS